MLKENHYCIRSTNFISFREREIMTVDILLQPHNSKSRFRISNLQVRDLLGKELDYPSRLYRPSVISEISRGHETPM
jgi:ATP sulfurylase